MSHANEYLPKSELDAITSALIAGARYGVKIRLPHAFVMTFLFKRQLSAKQKLKIILKLTFEHASNLSAFAALYKSILAILKKSSRQLKISNISEHNRFCILGRALLLTILDGNISSYSHHIPSSNMQIAHPGIAQSPYHSFIAGLIGGYTVWGRYSSVNYQIVLYLTSRVIAALTTQGVQTIIQRLHPKHPHTALPGSNSPSSIMIETRYYSTIATWLTFENAYPWLAASVWGAIMVLFETYPESLQHSLKKSMEDIYKSQKKEII